MTTAAPLTRYGAQWGRASRAAPLPPQLHHVRGHDLKYDPLEAAIIANVSDWVLPTAPKSNGAGEALALAIAQRDDLSKKVNTLKDLLEYPKNNVLQGRFHQREAELAAKESEVRALQAKASQGVAALPAKDRQAGLVRLIGQLSTATGTDLYALRASINAALKSIVDYIDFDPSGDVRVVVLGGAKAYRRSSATVGRDL